MVPVGIVMAHLIFFFSLKWRSVEESLVENYENFMLIALFSVVIEILSEPFWIMMQMLFLIKERIQIDGYALIIRCFTIFIFVFYFQFGLLSFALGQLSYSICLLCGFFFYFYKTLNKQNQSVSDQNNQNNEKSESPFPFTCTRELFPSLPKKLANQQTKEKIYSILTFSWQSFEKLLLQESEKIVLKFTNTFLNQGVFSVVSNLGSLVARFLFLPIEEISFMFFSKLLNQNVDEKTSKELKNENILLCSNVLIVILKFMIIIGNFCFVSHYKL